MTNSKARQNLDAELDRLLLEQTIEDIETEIEGSAQTATEAAIARLDERSEATLASFRKRNRALAEPIEAVHLGEAHRLRLRSFSEHLEEMREAAIDVLRIALIGEVAEASASSKDTRTSELQGVIWTQDDVVFTINADTLEASTSESEFVVHLEFDKTPARPPRAVVWADPKAPVGDGVQINSYAVRCEEDGSYIVEIRKPSLSRRLRAIDRAKTAKDEDRVLAFAPFVELG